MIHPFSIEELLRQLQTLNYADCSPAMLSAIGGLLNLCLQQGDSKQLKAHFSQVCDTVIEALRTATDTAEEEQWLRTLYHLIPDEDNHFVNAIDDEEYTLLTLKRSRITSRWTAEVAILLAAAAPGSSLPVASRLHRLWWLYAHTDIPALTRGDDEETRRLFRLSKPCFDHCTQELFAAPPITTAAASPHQPSTAAAKNSSFFILHSSFYYAVLCAIYPGKHRLAHQPYYKQFMEQLRLTPADTPESYWQRLEIETHYAQSPMHRADRYVLPELAILDPQACRHHLMKCYQYWADLDPDDDGTTTDADEQQQTLALARQHLYNWLHAKHANGIPIPPEQEAQALTLIIASSLLTMANENVINRASELLPTLPKSRNKTILAALLGFITDDHALLEELKADVSRLSKTTDHIDPYGLFVRAITWSGL